jgi:hypothetical protein
MVCTSLQVLEVIMAEYSSQHSRGMKQNELS